MLLEEAAEPANETFVVGGDAAEDAAGGEIQHESFVVAIDVPLFREGELGWFLVRAFAEAYADSLFDQPAGVGDGAVKIGLEDGADTVRPDAVEALGEREGRLSVGGTLHVNAYEVADLIGVDDHAGEDGFGEGGVEVQAELGKLDADVGVEPALGDLVEDLVVDRGAAISVFGVGDALTEGVKRDGEAFRVHFSGGLKGGFNGHACDKAARKFLAEGGALGEGTELRVAGEGDEEGTEQGYS